MEKARLKNKKQRMESFQFVVYAPGLATIKVKVGFNEFGKLWNMLT